MFFEVYDTDSHLRTAVIIEIDLLRNDKTGAAISAPTRT